MVFLLKYLIQSISNINLTFLEVAKVKKLSNKNLHRSKGLFLKEAALPLKGVENNLPNIFLQKCLYRQFFGNFAKSYNSQWNRKTTK
ncbi:MAG: hypothetical protein PHR53_01940 [Bacteroidales bacterium]|nr:hypothetical protein [Bacteroidales bacterium]